MYSPVVFFFFSLFILSHPPLLFPSVLSQFGSIFSLSASYARHIMYKIKCLPIFDIPGQDSNCLYHLLPILLRGSVVSNGFRSSFTLLLTRTPIK